MSDILIMFRFYHVSVSISPAVCLLDQKPETMCSFSVNWQVLAVLLPLKRDI